MPKTLEDTLLKELRCPMCSTFMYPPIFECDLGHSFCHPCFKKTPKCQICNARKHSTRNLALEAIRNKVTFPCKYADIGCNFRALGKQIRNHQYTCEVGRRPCPMKPRYNCQFVGDTADITNHLRDSHTDSSVFGSETYFTIKNLSKVKNERKHTIMVAFKELFRIVYHIEYKDVEGKTRWAVHYLGNETQYLKNDFSYKIEFLRKFEERNTPKCLIYQSKVVHEKQIDYNSRFHKVFEENNHFSIDKSVLQQYCVNEELKVIVTVYDNTVDEQEDEDEYEEEEVEEEEEGEEEEEYEVEGQTEDEVEGEEDEVEGDEEEYEEEDEDEDGEGKYEDGEDEDMDQDDYD